MNRIKEFVQIGIPFDAAVKASLKENGIHLQILQPFGRLWIWPKGLGLKIDLV
jgi:hypothetical protein